MRKSFDGLCGLIRSEFGARRRDASTRDADEAIALACGVEGGLGEGAHLVGSLSVPMIRAVELEGRVRLDVLAVRAIEGGRIRLPEFIGLLG